MNLPVGSLTVYNVPVRRGRALRRATGRSASVAVRSKDRRWNLLQPPPLPVRDSPSENRKANWFEIRVIVLKDIRVPISSSKFESQSARGIKRIGNLNGHASRSSGNRFDTQGNPFPKKVCRGDLLRVQSRVRDVLSANDDARQGCHAIRSMEALR